ncbi:MAG: hypothetical protein IKJ24_03415, partial [Clostridia bacterium]|nr:hypothetical protein [Clostridia bacterium]
LQILTDLHSPLVALSNDKGFRSLRRATAELGGSAKPFEKGLSENFKIHCREVTDKSKFENTAGCKTQRKPPCRYGGAVCCLC